MQMNSQPKHRALPAVWALYGALMAVSLGAVPLLPGLHIQNRRATLAAVLSLAAGASIGALAGLLYQGAGRLRFWGLAGVLGLSLLAYAAIGRPITSTGTLLIWSGALAIIGLSLWVLLAYGLSTLRRRRRH